MARRSGVTVEDGTFEEWEPAGRTFDLLTCGQAWHWVAPDAGAAKAADVVRLGGQVALFWNQGRPDGDLRDALEAVYQEVAPGLEEYSILLRDLGTERFEEAAASLTAAGAFDRPRVRSYPWTRTCERDEWVEHLMTHSDHRTMDPGTRATLVDGVGGVIDRFGGTLMVRYACSLITARRSVERSQRGDGGLPVAVPAPVCQADRRER